MRGKPAIKRIIFPDTKYHDVTLAKFINYVMKGGKKSVARRVVYNAMELIREKMQKEPLVVFDMAIKNVTPLLEVRSRRIGGGNYQIPYPVRGDRRNALAFRWIIGAARAQKGRSMSVRLANEFMAAAQKQGDAIKKKMDVHRMAEANRAFAHFAR